MNDLVSVIGETVEKLERGYREHPEQPNFMPLKDLEHFCEKYLFRAKTPAERVSAFFLSRHLNNFFLNLGGEAFYDEQLRYVKKNIFSGLLHSLKEMQENITKEDHQRMCAGFNDIIKNYTDQILILNQHY